MKIKPLKIAAGYSLIELLVVIALFSIISVVATQSLTLSLRGTKKSESVIEVKNNVEYALSTMERLLRNAQEINCLNTITPSGTAGPAAYLTYIDEYGQEGQFSCQTSGTVNYIASTSAAFTNAALTNKEVATINNCTTVFKCNFSSISPSSVEIKIEAINPNNAILGAEGASVNAQTRVLLRNY